MACPMVIGMNLFSSLMLITNLTLHACKFPGWGSFASFIAHIQFVNGHHKHVKKVALCTDAPFGTLVEKLGAHFVSAEIKVFPFDELIQAKQWIGV